MTLSDLIKLIRHYLKFVIAVPIACAVLTALVILIAPPTYEAKATLLTSGDFALAGGFAQSEAEKYSQNGIEVTTKSETSSRTITVVAEGSDYGGCIAAANATVLAAGDDIRNANNQTAISTNEATSADSSAPSIPKVSLLALLVGLFVVICALVIVDMVKTPIKSKNDIEATTDLPIIGVIPNRDRGERLLANVRFLSDKTPSSIAVIPVGLTGATLTCAELASAFEHAHTMVTRVKGSPHAEGLTSIALPEIVTIIECAPISEGMGAVYIAKDVDVTILCVNEWRDTRKALASVVEELRFAKAEIGGVVFLTAGYAE